MGRASKQTNLAPTTQALPPEDTPPERKRSEGEKQMMVYSSLANNIDFIKVRSSGAVYCRPIDGGVYRLMTMHDLQTLSRDAYLSLFGVGDVDKIKKAAEGIKLFIKKEIDEVTSSIVQVSPDIYWDGEIGELVSGQPDKERVCFHRLFNTQHPSKHIVQVDMSKGKPLIMGYYKDTLEFLEKHTPDELPMDFDFIKTWANGKQDVYVDLLRSIAYCFLKRKPVGSYILIGERRNGKSSFVGMLHTIFGDQNTSMVRLSQLGDGHYTHQLLNSMLNAPDEEDDKVVSAQADFKTLADHGVLTIPVMRSNEPVVLQADFMCFYPMNHMPEWKGSGAGACLKRSLVIPFYADLSEYDNGEDNFAETTFTPTMMAKLMGVVFALAHYYSNKPLEFSLTMQREQRVLEEEQDSAFEYRDEFLHFFDGFTTKKELYEDYVNWCKTYDKRISTKKEFDFLWREIYAQRSTYKLGKIVYQVRRLPRTGHYPLVPGLKLTGLNIPRVADMWEHGLSVVAELSAYEAEKLGEAK